MTPCSLNSGQTTSTIPGKCLGFLTEMPFLLFSVIQTSPTHQMSPLPADTSESLWLEIPLPQHRSLSTVSLDTAFCACHLNSVCSTHLNLPVPCMQHAHRRLAVAAETDLGPSEAKQTLILICFSQRHLIMLTFQGDWKCPETRTESPVLGHFCIFWS